MNGDYSGVMSLKLQEYLGFSPSCLDRLNTAFGSCVVEAPRVLALVHHVWID